MSNKTSEKIKDGLGCLGCIISIVFLIWFFRTQCDFIWDAIEEHRNRPGKDSFQAQDAEHVFESTRMAYDFGNARTLTEDAHIILVYVNDDNSQWTEENANIFSQDVVLPCLNFIKEQAASYGYSIDLPVTTYYATIEGTIYDHYQETEDGSYETADITLDSFSVPPKIAQALGYEGNMEMLEAHRKELDAKQIAYIFIPNCTGWSHACKKDSEQGNYNLEYCMVYPYQPGDTPTAASTVAHETLHQFGAEDLYEKDGQRVGRAQLASELHPYEIMLHQYPDISENMVGKYTAYTIGWLDEFPEEYNTDTWWN